MTLSCRACGADSGFVQALDRLVHLTRAHVGRVVDEAGNWVDIEHIETDRRRSDLDGEAAELALRAKRRAGELLAETPKQAGARTPTESQAVTPTLDELGVSKIDSSRWQAVASVPEDEEVAAP
jgi:hypothetical protein